MNSTYQQLCKNLEQLKLTQMQLHLNEVADFVAANNLSFSEGLLKLTNYEADYKAISAARSMVKSGAFPHQKELKDFDFSFQPGINQQEIFEYNTLRFLEQQENLVFLGPSGVGKTHLATSIGITCARSRISTYFIPFESLITQLKKALLENRLESRLKHFAKYKVLIIDEIGYMPIDTDSANLFFQLIAKRYEKNCTIITTNTPFSRWGEIFGSPTLANAVLDRLLHHSQIVSIKGPSYRLREKRAYMETQAEE